MDCWLNKAYISSDRKVEKNTPRFHSRHLLRGARPHQALGWDSYIFPCFAESELFLINVSTTFSCLILFILNHLCEVYDCPNYANILLTGDLLTQMKCQGQEEAHMHLTVSPASPLRDVDGLLCDRKNKCKSNQNNYIFTNRKSLRQKMTHLRA